ncbi:MAG: carbohydrate kinase family protein [Thermoanaerobaculia bacterium]|nr:carbohydrate kinase family protein [Thermoanaerobaculia bacterium]
MARERVRPRIFCFGGAVVDRSLRPLHELRRGTSNPVVTAAAPGGVARNVAEGLARLGVPVSLCSIVGEDADGDRLVHGLAAAGVDVERVQRSPHAPTAGYWAVLDPRGELYLGLADMEIFEGLDDAWAEAAMADAEAAKIWVVDANLDPVGLGRLLRTRRQGTTVAADPVSEAKAGRLRPFLDRIDVLFPDRGELAELADLPAEDDGQVAAAADRLRRLGVGAVVVSLGERGVYVDDGERRQCFAALPPARVRDVTGAGDALLAGWVWALAAAPGVDPVRAALAAASLAVESARTVPAELTPERLLRRATAVGEAARR